MPAAALPSIGRFLAEVPDAPLAAPMECGVPNFMRRGERTPDGYRIGDHVPQKYTPGLPDKYETLAILGQTLVPYTPQVQVYDKAVNPSDAAAILASGFPERAKEDALSRLAMEKRFVPLAEYPSGEQSGSYSAVEEAEQHLRSIQRRKSNYILDEAEEIVARSESDPLGIGPTRKYDLSRDNVTLTNNPELNRYLDGVLKDDTPSREAGNYFGTGFSEDDRRITFFVDNNLRGTPTLAYVVDTPDIKETYPKKGRELERAYGSYPLMALNPQVIAAMNPGMTVAYTPSADEQLKAVLGHEKTHLRQKGKITAKSVTYPVLVHLGRHIITGEDVYRAVEVPAGEAFVEGGVEVAMKARGLKPPTDYFPPSTLYNQYRNLVERVEKRSPGFLNQFLRTARKKGVRAAKAYMGRIAGDSIVEYLRELNPGVEILKFPEEAELYPIAA